VAEPASRTFSPTGADGGPNPDGPGFPKPRTSGFSSSLARRLPSLADGSLQLCGGHRQRGLVRGRQPAFRGRPLAPPVGRDPRWRTDECAWRGGSRRLSKALIALRLPGRGAFVSACTAAFSGRRGRASRALPEREEAGRVCGPARGKARGQSRTARPRDWFSPTRNWGAGPHVPAASGGEGESRRSRRCIRASGRAGRVASRGEDQRGGAGSLAAVRYGTVHGERQRFDHFGGLGRPAPGLMLIRVRVGAFRLAGFGAGWGSRLPWGRSVATRVGNGPPGKPQLGTAGQACRGGRLTAGPKKGVARRWHGADG